MLNEDVLFVDMMVAVCHTKVTVKLMFAVCPLATDYNIVTRNM